MKKSYQVIALVLIVLVIDQALKIWVKTHMPLYDNIAYIGQWANLHFVENPGMAFGMELGGNYGKLALSIFRIVAVGFLFYYIRQLLKSNAPAGLILGFGAIFAGAVGNIIDCLFYGMIFSASSYHTVAQIFPVEGGYGSLLHGKVVDMFYFNLFKFPDWVPFLKAPGSAPGAPCAASSPSGSRPRSTGCAGGGWAAWPATWRSPA